MSNRLTGLDVTQIGIFGTNYATNASSIRIEPSIKTAEGKGIATVDDWPVLVGRGCTVTADLMVASGGSVPFMGSVFASSGASGTVAFTTGGATYTGTALVTANSHSTDREGIQTVNVTLTFRGVAVIS